MSRSADPIDASPGLVDLPDPMPRPLVVRARTDREAFGELYDLNHGMIYRYCRRRLSDRAAAEDACSAVFVVIAEHLPTFTGETLTDFRRWAFAIARNHTASTRRRRGRRQRLLLTAAENGSIRVPGGPHQDDQPSHMGEQLEEAITQLNERDQILIDLRYSEELSHEEIGRILKMRAGSVRTATTRALSRLRRFLTSKREGLDG